MNQQELKDHMKWLNDKFDNCIENGNTEHAKILYNQIKIYEKELRNERGKAE